MNIHGTNTLCQCSCCQSSEDIICEGNNYGLVIFISSDIWILTGALHFIHLNMPKKGEVHRTSYLLQAVKKIILPLNGRNIIIGKHTANLIQVVLLHFVLFYQTLLMWWEYHNGKRDSLIAGHIIHELLERIFLWYLHSYQNEEVKI